MVDFKRIATGQDFALPLADALGIPKNLLRSITLEAGYGDCVFLTVEYLVSEDKLNKVATLLKRYRLEEIPNG